MLLEEGVAVHIPFQLATSSVRTTPPGLQTRNCRRRKEAEVEQTKLELHALEGSSLLNSVFLYASGGIVLFSLKDISTLLEVSKEGNVYRSGIGLIERGTSSFYLGQ